MKSLQKPANLPDGTRRQDNAMAAKRVSAASRGITPNIGVPVTPVRVSAAAAPAAAAPAPAAAAPAPAAAAPAPATPRELDAKRIQAAKDLYEVLEVSKTASKRDITMAYRKKMLLHHTNKGGSRAESDKVQEAYETLTDQEKRDAYDITLGIKKYDTTLAIKKGGRRRITVNRHLSRRNRSSRRTTYRR
jgi:DnaJ-domain-containing protein 1